MFKTLHGLYFIISLGPFASEDMFQLTTCVSTKDHSGKKEMSPSPVSCCFILKHQNKMTTAAMWMAHPYNAVTSERKVRSVEGKPVETTSLKREAVSRAC